MYLLKVNIRIMVRLYLATVTMTFDVLWTLPLPWGDGLCAGPMVEVDR